MTNWIPLGYISKTVHFEGGFAKGKGIYIHAADLINENIYVKTQIAHSRDYGLPYMIIYDIKFCDIRDQWPLKQKLQWCREHFQTCYGTHRIFIWDYYMSTLSELYRYAPNMCFHTAQFTLSLS